ncbi:MAG: SDR family oxidoreductase [Polyangiales bacterium]|nr:SDR family oxidoreductase [Myxococcales bacterium]
MSQVFAKDLLSGRVAFVTGGASGICRAVTRKLMAHGADAVIVSRTQEKLDAAARELRAETGRRCVGLRADVRKPEEVEAAVKGALEQFGRLDVVVNGAAGNFLCPAAQLSYNAFRTVMDIDTNGTFNVSKAAFEAWLRDHGGSIINISATLHYGATPLQAHASAAKAAIDSLTRTLALEWGRLDIRVNAIAPGPIDETEGVSRLVPPDLRKKMEDAIPMGRFGRADEIGDVALFLASDAASLLTGSILVADGGAWLGGRALEF